MARVKVKSLKEIAELAECGKRISGVINQVVTDFNPWEIRNCWLAFKLEDGRVYGGNQPALFDSQAAARKHTDQWKYCYVNMQGILGGLSQKDAEIFLDFHRQARDVNLAQSDPNRSAMMPFPAGDTYQAAQRGELP